MPEPAISPTMNNTAKVTVNPPFDFSSPRKDVVSSFLLSEFSLVVFALRNFSISGEWEFIISYALINFGSKLKNSEIRFINYTTNVLFNKIFKRKIDDNFIILKIL